MSDPNVMHAKNSASTDDSRSGDEGPQFKDVNDDAAAGTALKERTKQPPRRLDRMPPWKVLLHNDNDNIMEDVVRALQEIGKLTYTQAMQRMLEAHHAGVSLIFTTHREHAELVKEQFESKLLTVSIEPDR